MTALYIAGEQVVLPDNFSTKIIEENPFFTKSGKYTYDVELSLLNPINQRAYKHINRLNFDAGTPTNRQAVLIVDNLIELNGTEVILSISSSSVRIQLVSGNSELNFIVGGNSKLRELDLGEITVVTESETGPDIIYRPHLMNYLSLGFPDKHFVLAPFLAADKGIICNSYAYNSNDPLIQPSALDFLSPIYRPLPFLNYIIQAVINALGYTFEQNALIEDPRFVNLMIVHGHITYEYSKMLPDWTVNEFLNNIEKQFNATFVVNEKTKNVDLMLNSAVFSSENFQDITVVDLFEMEIDDKNTISLSNGNIGYDLDDYITYKYDRLAPEIKEYAIADTYTNAANLNTKVNNSLDADRFKKVFSGSLGKYIASVNTPNFGKRVDRFSNLIQNEKESLDFEFKMLPAPMIDTVERVVWVLDVYQYYAQMPVSIETQISAAEEVLNYQIEELITGDEEIKTISQQSKMYLAIYTGIQYNQYLPGEEFEEGVPGFPISATQDICEYFDSEPTKLRYFLEEGFRPFDLNWLRANLYDTGNIDTTKLYKIVFRNKKEFNILEPFIANNKKFICYKYYKDIDKKGYSDLYQGEFYPLD